MKIFCLISKAAVYRLWGVNRWYGSIPNCQWFILYDWEHVLQDSVLASYSLTSKFYQVEDLFDLSVHFNHYFIFM